MGRVFVFVVLSVIAHANAFYVPGVAPRDFDKDEAVEIRV